MNTRTRHQTLPTKRGDREKLRDKGQFWTPDWVAKAMARYILNGRPDSVFDPAIGEGALLQACAEVARCLGYDVALRGREIDPSVLQRARAALSCDLNASLRDFVLETHDSPLELKDLDAVIANPPYVRHHRLDSITKQMLRRLAVRSLGFALDGRAGYHVYFLLAALLRLRPGARLAFILPSDTMEGVFAKSLWTWISRHYRIDAVLTFAPEATPFPGVDTNAVVVMLENSVASCNLAWGHCVTAESKQLYAWVEGSFRPVDGVDALVRPLAEALETGLSRMPSVPHDGVILADVARTMRGIATGANGFFCLTSEDVARLGIPQCFLVRTICRTRDLLGDVRIVDEDLLTKLDEAGRPTYLLTLDGRDSSVLPESVRKYLELGERLGISQRPLIAQRSPWYRMERRRPPDFLFAYLGRRNVRFIRNDAGVVPLNAFHCVYMNCCSGRCKDKLWEALLDERVSSALRGVGKSYGGGAIKVEPRALDLMPLEGTWEGCCVSGRSVQESLFGGDL